MKLALIYELGPSDDGSFLGGIESHILGLARHLAKDNDVTLITGAIPGGKSETEMDGFRVLRSDILGLVERSWDPTNLTSPRQLFSIPASMRVGREVDAELYHGHIYASGLVALELGRMGGASSVNTIHGSYYDHWEAITGSRLRSIGYRAAERLLATFLARKCDRQIHTASDFAKKVTEWGGPRDRIRVILNGVDTEKFSPSVQPTLETSGRPVVMTVRRLVPKNGVRFFVEASRSVSSQVEFVIVGEGPERRGLERLVERLGVGDRVHFLGGIPNDKLPGVLAAADIVVVPSLVEASSISLLEAMAMAKPTVVTDIPGIDEVASEERSIMVSPANPVEIAESIDRLISSPGMQRGLAERAREYVVGQRSEKVVAEETMKVYAEAMEL